MGSKRKIGLGTGTPGQSYIRELTESWEREFPGMDLENFLVAIYLLRLGRLVGDDNEHRSRTRFGISGSDMGLLFALRRAGKPYVRKAKELYRAVLVTSGAVTKQVDRLANLGLVQRIEDPRRRSGTLIQLTSKGIAVTTEASELLIKKSSIAPGTENLSASERASGRRFLEVILTALEPARFGPNRRTSRK